MFTECLLYFTHRVFNSIEYNLNGIKRLSFVVINFQEPCGLIRHLHSRYMEFRLQFDK